jgi:hypothetical protein
MLSKRFCGTFTAGKANVLNANSEYEFCGSCTIRGYICDLYPLPWDSLDSLVPECPHGSMLGTVLTFVWPSKADESGSAMRPV